MPEETPKESSPVNWTNLQRKLVVLFSVIGIAIGYASYAINSSPVGFVAMAVVGAALFFATKKLVKNLKKRWWGNPVFAYIFFWLVSWTIFFNLWTL